jgi:hypothetical protein
LLASSSNAARITGSVLATFLHTPHKMMPLLSLLSLLLSSQFMVLLSYSPIQFKPMSLIEFEFEQ